MSLFVFLNFNEELSRQDKSSAQHSPWPGWGLVGCCRPVWAWSKVASRRGGQGDILPSDEMSWGEREKNKNKRCLCLEKGLGSAPVLGAFGKGAVVTLVEQRRQTAMPLKVRGESQAPGESISVETSGLPCWPLLMRMRGRRKLPALGPQVWPQGEGEGEALSEEPPNMRNGSPCHTHRLLSLQLCDLKAQRRQCNFTNITDRAQ